MLPGKGIHIQRSLILSRICHCAGHTLAYCRPTYPGKCRTAICQSV